MSAAGLLGPNLVVAYETRSLRSQRSRCSRISGHSSGRGGIVCHVGQVLCINVAGSLCSGFDVWTCFVLKLAFPPFFHPIPPETKISKQNHRTLSRTKCCNISTQTLISLHRDVQASSGQAKYPQKKKPIFLESLDHRFKITQWDDHGLTSGLVLMT